MSPAPDPGRDSSRLRIAFLDSWKSTAREGSGTAVAIARLARGLEELGHRVERMAPPGAPSPSLPDRVRYNLTLDRRLRRQGPWNLVVGFDVDGICTRPAAPFVVSLKGVAADEARFERGRARRLLSFLARVEASNARRASRVIVPSRYSAAVVVREYGVRAQAVRVVPEPIEPERWQRPLEQSPARPGRPTVLSVARQYPRKDTATLIRAMERVRREVPGAHLRVIGGGPELPRLRTLAHDLDLLGNTVTLDGAVARDEEVREAYARAHVFALPSRQEGFGIAFAEAMAASLPVVAARAGAVPELVDDGTTGILVGPGDAPALSRALVRLLTSPEEARRMGEAGRRRARRFAVDRVARRFLEACAGTGAASSTAFWCPESGIR